MLTSSSCSALPCRFWTPCDLSKLTLARSPRGVRPVQSETSCRFSHFGDPIMSSTPHLLFHKLPSLQASSCWCLTLSPKAPSWSYVGKVVTQTFDTKMTVYLCWLVELFGIAPSELWSRNWKIVLLVDFCDYFRLGGDVELLEGLQATCSNWTS